MVGRSVGEQILKATGSEEETQAVQAVVQSFVAANALDLDMSPKQFWQEYGATILGEPDVKRDAKGNLVEVGGKNPSQWLNRSPESYQSVLGEAGTKLVEIAKEGFSYSKELLNRTRKKQSEKTEAELKAERETTKYMARQIEFMKVSQREII